MGILRKYVERFTLKPYRTQLLSAIAENTQAISDLHQKIFADNPVAIIGNVKMYLPLFYIDHIQKIIYNSKNFYEIETLQFLQLHYKSFEHIVDIGSNIGNHALFYCSHLNPASVRCFEPNRFSREILQENITMNHFDSIVEVFPVALGDEAGKGREQFFTLANTGMNQVQKVQNDLEDKPSIEIKKLDDYKIEKVDFIKIDVEGFELNVLKGAEETIRRLRPVLLIETFDENRKRVEEFLSPYRYKNLIKLDQSNYLYNPI